MSTFGTVVLAFCVVGALGSCRSHAPRVQNVPRSSRIIGGVQIPIEKYPSAAMLLDYHMGHYGLKCGGVIINNRSVLTAADCIREFVPVSIWRIRVGSNFITSGGIVHRVSRLILHPEYNMCTRDNDIGIIRSATAFEYSNTVQRARLASRNYVVRDSEVVYAVGWGAYNQKDQFYVSEELREGALVTINAEECKDHYKWWSGLNVTDGMICTSLGFSGKGQCLGDTGGPIYHQGAVVGIHVWTDVIQNCSEQYAPGVNMKISSYVSWISENA
ncbi:unnamed protein product [Leptosia nina]|uniref:Peptidase S1 domain-containing protein n=1 Tax=Leptosia nina TaxID=320188 RepID=A0AAV1IT05_9NEOP